MVSMYENEIATIVYSREGKKQSTSDLNVSSLTPTRLQQMREDNFNQSAW